MLSDVPYVTKLIQFDNANDTKRQVGNARLQAEIQHDRCMYCNTGTTS